MVARYGDPLPILLVASGVIVALAVRKEVAVAGRFVLYFIIAMAIGTATKFAYYDWGIRFGIASFHGVSGHVLRSFATYPTLGFVVTSGSSRTRQLAGMALGAMVALVVMADIVFFGFHTPVEAVSGALLGLVVPTLIARHDRLAAFSSTLQFLFVAAVLLSCACAAYSPRAELNFENTIARRLQEWLPGNRASICATRPRGVACDHAGESEGGG